MKYFLYGLGEEPDCREDVAASHPERVESLVERLEEWLRWDQAAQRLSPAPAAQGAVKGYGLAGHLRRSSGRQKGTRPCGLTGSAEVEPMRKVAARISARLRTVREAFGEKPGWLLWSIAAVIVATVSLRGIGNPNLGYPDADRILMDGVFLLDLLRDLPLTRIYDYTVNYFGQYPALSIGYRPPFFPLVEALFNGAFGINIWSSRLALLTIWLVGLAAWFALVRRVYGLQVAFWSMLLLGTTPFLAQWGWYTMAELAVLGMALCTAFTFYRYTETAKPFYLYATAVLFVLTVWTKQTAIFLALWFLLYLLAAGILPRPFKSWHGWASVGIVLVGLAPLAAITLWLGDQNIAQSVGTGQSSDAVSRLSWSNLKIHLGTLVQYHLTAPVLVLSAVGVGWAAWKRDRRVLYFLLLIVSTYIFFAYLIGKNPRYPIFWIPAFAVLAALPLRYLAARPRLQAAGVLVLAAVVGYQVFQIYEMKPAYATGYQEAAQYVLRHSDSPTVFFDGWNNGYFTYFVRANDPKRSMYVLRGDKLLSSSSVQPNIRLKVHAQGRKDIRGLLQEYGVQYIVVESKEPLDLEIHRELRRYLKEGPFKLAKQIPVKSQSRTPLAGQELKIYRYTNAKALTKDYMELRLPVVGKTIKVRVREPSR